MQALDELADLRQRHRQLGLRALDQSRHLGRLGLDSPADEMEVQRDRDEALLCPVVQVPLDSAAFLVAGRDDPGS